MTRGSTGAGPTALLAQAMVSESNPTPSVFVAEWGEDLFLMSHFISSTCLTFSGRDDMRYLWQRVVPEDAVAHSFLMHSILAISAMHLSSLRPLERPRFARLSRRHLNEAIPEYRRQLENIGAENGGPILATACLLGLSAQAAISDNSLQRDGGDNGRYHPPIDAVIVLFTIIRGVRDIISPRPFRAWMDNSPYVALATGHGPPVNYSQLPLPEHIRRQYSALKLQCLPELVDSGDTKTLAVCIESALLLEQVHREIIPFWYQGPGLEAPEESFLLRWLAMVSVDFVFLLKEHHNAALVILGQFFSLFRNVQGKWFLESWAKNGLKSIRDASCPGGEEWLVKLGLLETHPLLPREMT